MRPFVITKCSAWLVSKVSPRLWGSKSGYTESAKKSYRTLLSSSPYITAHTHTHTYTHTHTRVTITLCSQCYGKTKQSCRNVCIWSSHLGSAAGGQWAAKSPWMLQKNLSPSKVIVNLTEDTAARRWRLECSLTSLSEHHISQIRRRGSVLIDRHARYVIAVTACSVCSRCLCAVPGITLGRLRLKCDGTRAETRFRLPAKRTSPFKSAWASVHSTTGSRGERISGSIAGYTMLRGSVKSTGYLLHSPVSPLTSPPVRHRVPSHFNWSLPYVVVPCVTTRVSGTDRYCVSWLVIESFLNEISEPRFVPIMCR
jgi:hypothetical protein